MKKSTFNALAISSLLLLSVSAVQAAELTETDDFTGNISGILGNKSLDDNDWAAQDSQGTIGVLVDVKKQSWPVSIVYGLVVSADVDKDNGLKTEAFTVESRIGIRKTFNLDGSPFSPYVGGGVAAVHAEVKNKNSGVTTSKDDDSSTGAWVGAGLNYAINDQFNVGFDVTYTDAEVTLFDADLEAGGLHSGITAGYSW